MSSEQYHFVLKIETDGVNASRILCLTLFDIDRHVSMTFTDRPSDNSISEAVEILEVVDGLIIVQTSYPLKMLRGLYHLKISDHRVMDTHEMAKLYRPKGNSLDAWAREFGIQRRKFLGSPTWTAFVAQHCERDAQLIALIYAHLLDQVVA
jgi:hypothetical protein